MAQTIRAEVAEKFLRFGGASKIGIFNRGVIPKTLASSVDGDVGVKAFRSCAETNSCYSATVVALQAPVETIFGLCRQSEIASPVVKTISIDVVNKRTLTVKSKNESVQKNCALHTFATRWVSNASGSVKRFAEASKLASVPLVFGYKIVVCVVNERERTLGERYLNHDCSLGNTLSGVTAIRKVRSFGSKPSRDASIIRPLLWQ